MIQIGEALRTGKAAPGQEWEIKYHRKVKEVRPPHLFDMLYPPPRETWRINLECGHHIKYVVPFEERIEGACRWLTKKDFQESYHCYACLISDAFKIMNATPGMEQVHSKSGRF